MAHTIVQCVLRTVAPPGQTIEYAFGYDSCEFLTHQSRLPKEGEENVLVTSALPYCNNVPHLGQ